MEGLGGGKALAQSIGSLVRDVLLDIFVNGTCATGVPDFESFIRYRQAKAFEYHIESRAREYFR